VRSVLLMTLLAGTAVHAAPPEHEAPQARLAQQVHQLDHAVDQQQAATRKLHQQVHALEQAQKQDAARLQKRDRTIQALRRQLRAAQQAPAAPASQGHGH
jgi:uncharacterized protein YlxW (UPF0749 family)